MTTRILKVIRQKGVPVQFYVPQREVGGAWLEFISYDTTSPYLHPKTFGSIKEAKAFLRNPSIFGVGVAPLVVKVVP